MPHTPPPCLNDALLAESRRRLAEGDAALQPALAQLRAEARDALALKPPSVMDKTTVPPSGDKHDYLSMGPYWWPNPDTPDSLPWVRRDGQVNPETESTGSDRPPFLAMAQAAETLALAWTFTGDSEAAARAALLLRTWFLDEATRMTPHLEYGQAIPGICDGRYIGIIDTSRLVHVINAACLIGNAPAWTAADRDSLRRWCEAFLAWLRESDFGRQEAAHPNNHGTWCDTQVAALALFTGQSDVAREVIERAAQRRIAAHIEPDGRQPEELARTRSLDYSLFNLRAMFLLAEMGEKLGVDLWSFRTPDSRCLRAALDYLAPHADLERPWPHEQIIESSGRTDALPMLLLRAARAWEDDRYVEAFNRLPEDVATTHRARLLYPL